MSINTSSQETINALEAIFEKHKEERVCVLGTTCCGKTTLLKKIPNCVDMDEALWPLLTQEEIDFVCQKPWTKEIGDFFDKLIYTKVKIAKGRPMFGTVILDCDVVVYLDIADDLLEAHCAKRNVSFSDAKNMKSAIESDWNNHLPFFISRGKPLIYTSIISQFSCNFNSFFTFFRDFLLFFHDFAYSYPILHQAQT